MKRVTRQGTQSYITTMGGVCMDSRGQQVQVIHTTPKMTATERKTAEKRVSNDLFNILSSIHKKLKTESE
ncbi:hypothetical protein [Clostridium sp. OS1-26]|uniref:hypothetical protein n=1 Tax=Clostridium sp. OS1-26 TaxID=3070681 RepID=UPI0027E129B2|nr:hypothetical protein [Clostridium sp. OS1-26]WML36955.1 hypothetical protein RCG18_10230 [Clostridium sp. OS1-26]